MKTNATTAALLLSFAISVQSSSAAALTDLERQRLVAHMEMTGSWLIDEVSGLSSAQLEFRPAPETWNILAVLEHLVIVQPVYWQELQTALRGASASPSSRPAPGRDADILWYGIDRSQRQKAIPAESPKGQLRDRRAGLDAYRKWHTQMLQYAKTTRDDLRSHIVAREGCDAYQWLLLISTHEQRHILQIREIKAAQGFPKE